MIRAAAAGGGGELPEDPTREPRRFHVRSQARICRPRSAVWDELAQLHHPAWSEHPEGEGTSLRAGSVTGLSVGAAQVALLPPGNNHGVRGIIYTEVKLVEPGYVVTTHSIVTGAFEQTETIRLVDHPNGGTLADCSSWFDTVPITEVRAVRLQHNLRRIQSGFLARAQDWTLGTAHRPNIICAEPEDLPYLC